MQTDCADRPVDDRDTPPLHRNRSFYSFIATESLGAFNDNVFKQLVLLLCVGHMVAGFDFQMIVQFLFALPFLLFSGLAGDIADRYSKGKLMVFYKVAEIVAMLLGLAVFFYTHSFTGGDGRATFFWLLAAVTFLMGAHSAFFGPPKYAGITEMVKKADLGMATGITQMTTFLAIVLGFSFAGYLMDNFRTELHIPGAIAVGIAVLGTITALGIKRNPPSDPNKQISLRSLYSMAPILGQMMKKDRLLFDVMVIYSWFWLVGAVALTAINNYGLFHLGMSNMATSQMVSIVSIGMAIGSLIVGRMSRGKVRIGLIKPGLIGMVVCLIGLIFLPVNYVTPEMIHQAGEMKDGLPGVPEAALWVKIAAFAIFFLLGGFVGFFTVPLMAFVQARPRLEEKGQVFAAFNWLSWLFIVAASGVYGLGMLLCASQAHWLLAALGALTLLVGILMIPGIFRRLGEEKPDYIQL